MTVPDPQPRLTAERPIYDPGSDEEIRIRFGVWTKGVELCVHSRMQWDCLSCLAGQIERSEYELGRSFRELAAVTAERDAFRIEADECLHRVDDVELRVAELEAELSAAKEPPHALSLAGQERQRADRERHADLERRLVLARERGDALDELLGVWRHGESVSDAETDQACAAWRELWEEKGDPSHFYAAETPPEFP